MSRLKLGKPAKSIIAIIESEGAKIVDTEKGSSHILLTYTFDGQQFFTQTAPYGSVEVARRALAGYRSQVRRCKPRDKS